jgi:hypothetical protein
MLRQMRDNATTATAATASGGGASLAWCGDPYPFSDGSLGAQTARFSASFTNTLNGNATCDVTASLTRNGTELARKASTFFKSTGAPVTETYLVSFDLPIAASAFAKDDRLNLRLNWTGSGTRCDGVTLNFGGPAQPGSLTVNSTRTPLLVTRPAAPTGLTAARQPDGTVRLTWPKSTSANIGFYRIYRDGKSYTQRVATSGRGTATEDWTDTNPGPARDYYVTAVTEKLLESTFVGPVRP